MIKLLYPLPRQLTVAFSGGLDSVAVVDFLSRNHDITCAFFHHNTENSEQAMKFVAHFCADRNLPLLFGTCKTEKDKKESMEEYWRRERYGFLEELGPVVTAHHLDDCVETYVWSALHGTPKVIPLVRKNVIRPFLTTPKSEFRNWCDRNNLKWCEDLSNEDTKYMRNYVRKYIIPHALQVNPGLGTVVKKVVEKQL